MTPRPGKATLTWASGPVPSLVITVPIPHLGWLTLVPGWISSRSPARVEGEVPFDDGKGGFMGVDAGVDFPMDGVTGFLNSWFRSAAPFKIIIDSFGNSIRKRDGIELFN